MTHKKLLLVIAMIVFVLSTAFVGNNPIEMKQTQNEDYKTAIIIAESLFLELKLKREDYKIITIENMVISGSKFEGSDIWKITFKSKSLFGKDQDGKNYMRGKGGELYIKVNLKTKKANHSWHN